MARPVTADDRLPGRFTVTVLSDGTHRDLAGRFAAALGEEFALLAGAAGPVADQPTSRRA